MISSVDDMSLFECKQHCFVSAGCFAVLADMTWSGIRATLAYRVDVNEIGITLESPFTSVIIITSSTYLEHSLNGFLF